MKEPEQQFAVGGDAVNGDKSEKLKKTKKDRSQEEILELKKSRMISDGELLSDGAGLRSIGNDLVLELNEKQKEKLAKRFSEKKKRPQEASFVKKEKLGEKQSKEKVFEELKELGILRTEDDLEVFDVEKFKSEFSKKFVRANKNLESFSRVFGEGKMAPALHKLFEGFQCVSDDDFEKGIKEEKDLVYFPKTSADALDIEKIKNSEFYLSLSDVIKNVPYDKLNYGNIEDLDYREVVLPLVIYHPNYCDGYRDEETGILQIKNKKGEYQKISAEYIGKNIGSFGDYSNSGGSIYSGRRFLREVTPHLLEKDLLRLTDFQVQIDQGLKTETNSKKIGTRGQAMFNNVRHWLGAEYENDIAYNIDGLNGVIVREDDDRKKTIVATFDVISAEQASATPKGYKTANISQTHPQKIDEQSFREKKEDETVEDYKKRIESLEGFQLGLQSEKYLREELGITLEKFSAKEQAMIAKMTGSMSMLEKDRMEDFIKNHGDNGLRSFLSLEHGGQEMGEKILFIGEKLEQESADAVFEKYAEIVDTTKRVEKYLEEQFGKEHATQSNEIIEKLLCQGKELLTLFAYDDSMDSVRVFEKLENIKVETELFKKSFKSLREGGQIISLEDLKATQFRILSGSELVDEERIVEKMKKIYLENYKDFPEEFRKRLVESLESKSKNPKAKFYTLHHQGEVVAFNSFTLQEDGTVHFANFNIDSKYQFSKLGEAMMEVSLDEEAKNATIVAEAVPDAPITKVYFEKKGFKKVGEIEVEGVKLWKIRREKGE